MPRRRLTPASGENSAPSDARTPNPRVPHRAVPEAAVQGLEGGGRRCRHHPSAIHVRSWDPPLGLPPAAAPAFLKAEARGVHGAPGWAPEGHPPGRLGDRRRRLGAPTLWPGPAISALPSAPRSSAGPSRGRSPALPSAHKRLFPTSHVSHDCPWPCRATLLG